MPYHLLTGATGLLGRYLLRDLLWAGLPIAVVARGNRIAAARHRVDAAMQHWEREAGRALPRPVVLEGDITSPRLGLGDEEFRWVAAHCDAVIHNAASLQFVAETPDGEPWRSNLVGTQNVLELCREAGIKQLHHVSTAYVCGLRSGTVYEHELDVGQQSGNDYERSKIQAETLVRQAPFLERTTVYRPSIIVGDSQTGFTTTYHGFYAPLQLVYGLAKAEPERVGAVRFIEGLNMGAGECKNFVPVEWVSAVAAHLISHPQFHGPTYHLTNPRPTPMGEMARAIWDEVAERLKLNADVPPGWGEQAEKLEQAYRQQMGVYQAYWRDDPTFDVTNTLRAAPHLPCPELTPEVMRMLTRFALDANFGWPREAVHRPALDVEAGLGPLPRPASPQNLVGLSVSGPGGGQWQVTVNGHGLEAAEPGLPDASPVVHLSSCTLAALLERRQTLPAAITAGSVVIERAASHPTSDDRLQHVVESILMAPRMQALRADAHRS